MEDEDGHTLALDVPEKQVLVYMEDAAGLGSIGFF
jgi:hypothetical protein